MNRLFGAVPFIVFALAAQAQESIGTEDLGFTIIYSDDTRENAIAKYQALFSTNQYESGGPAVPFEGKFVDDRQCHWNTSGYIQRDVCVVSRRLGEKCEGQWRKVFDVNRVGAGTDFHIGLDRVTLQGENCGMVQDRIQQHAAETKKLLIDEMHNVMKNDFQSVINLMENSPDVAEVRRN